MRVFRWLRHTLLTHHERGPWLALLVTAVFGYVQVIGHSGHELWKDELHCYGVGRSARGLVDLLTGERRYDGHPFLWYYLLHLGSRVHRGWATLPVVSATVATLAAFVWFRHARVPRLLRLLLLASYYFVYEYGVLSRSYTLGMLLVFVFCALYHPRRVRYVPLGFILFLCAATSLYGTLIALVLAAFLFSHDLGLAAPDASSDRTRLALSIPWVAGLCIFGAGLALVVVTTNPPTDAMYAPSWQFDFSSAAVRGDFVNFWGALLPFHSLTDWSWLYIDYLGSDWGLSANQVSSLGFGCFVLFAVALRRVPKLVAVFVVGVLLMMAVQHGIYPAALRHRGHYLILMLACLWLHERQLGGKPRAYTAYILLGLIASVQAVTGFVAMRTELTTVFSDAPAAARFMREHQLDQLPVVGSTDHATSPIAIMLDRPFLYQESGETHQVVLEHNRRVQPNVYQIMGYAIELANQSGTALMLVNYENPVAVPDGYHIRLLYRGQPALMYDESYRIYEITRVAPAAQAPAPTQPPPSAPQTPTP